MSYAAIVVKVADPREIMTVIPFMNAGTIAVVTLCVFAAGLSRPGLGVGSGSAPVMLAGPGGTQLARPVEREETFWCPMHPDIRSADRGTCPVCGMSLVPIPPPAVTGEYRLDVTQIPGANGRGAEGLRLVVRAPGTNAPVSRFVTVHERPFHLFIVSRDLESFAHVHPDESGDGALVLSHALAPGEYMLIADFLPEGGTSQMVQKAIIVAGPGPPAGVAAARTGEPAEPAEPAEDDGLRMALKSRDLAPGKRATLTFTITDGKTNAPVTDLEPFLGAPAHLLIVKRDLGDAIHGHPEGGPTHGPTLAFRPLMPVEGSYRLWIQVQRGSRVVTKSFDIRVDR